MNLKELEQLWESIEIEIYISAKKHNYNSTKLLPIEYESINIIEYCKETKPNYLY